MCTSLLQGWMSMTWHSPVRCSVTKWITRMGSTSCRWMHLAAWFKAHFWLMYSVGRHSRRSSSNRNRTGKPYAAHLARLDYLLIYLSTQVQLTLTKIIKIVATRWRILRLKCTKFDFGWGSTPDPAGGAYSAPPDTLAGFGGPTSKGRGGERLGRVRGGEWKGREGRGKKGGGEGKGGGRKGPWPPQYLEEVYASADCTSNANTTGRKQHIAYASIYTALRPTASIVVQLIHACSYSRAHCQN